MSETRQNVGFFLCLLRPYALYFYTEVSIVEVITFNSAYPPIVLGCIAVCLRL